MELARVLSVAPDHDRPPSLQPHNRNPESQTATTSDRNSAAAIYSNRRPKDEDKDDFITTFERNLAVVSWLALGAAGLHNLTWFLGFCALTWASVVLLGGLVSFLEKRDFYLVSSLLLLEASRFVAAVFFSNLVTRSLVTFTFERHSYDRKRKYLLVFLRIIAPAGQLLFVSPSIAFPVLALRSVHYEKGTSSFNSTDASLYIFYYLVVINASIATIALLYSLLVSLALLYWSEYESLQRYYDEILWRGACNGLLLANNFDFLVFAFEVQGQEYSRLVHAKIVQEKYRDLIQYLLNNPRGIEVACISLESDDSYQQQAAANIVGLWADTNEKIKLPFQTQLLSKLADKLNMGETGRAAANSFKSLWELCPKDQASQPHSVAKHKGKKAVDAVDHEQPCRVHRVELVEDKNGKKVVDILIDAIDPANSLSLICVKALLPLVEEKKLPKEKISVLMSLVRDIIDSREGIWVGEKITAYYALFQLEGKLTEEDKSSLSKMEPKCPGEYLLLEEMNNFKCMLPNTDLKDTKVKSMEVKDYNEKDPPFPKRLPFVIHLCLIVAILVICLVVGAKYLFAFLHSHIENL